MFGGRFPFGGFGGMRDEDEDDLPQQANNEQYYNILGVKKNASQQEIKKRYKELVKQFHPDKKNGDSKKYQELTQAYQTLSDPEKRKNYDKYGTNQRQPRGHQDLLNMFFGGGRGNAARKRQIPKTKPTKKALPVTLQDIYNGTTIKLDHTRSRCCQKCAGKGGQNVQKCKDCKGKGVVVQMFQMGPGMYQQVQKHCDKCQGQGQIISQGGKCKVCNGKKILEKSKTVEVPIEKGIPNNYPITITGQGNQIPDALAGDLILIVQQQQHKLFTRKGADLYMKKNITLLEALIGFQFSLTHLDGHEFVIYSKKGEVVSDKSKKVVRGLGMPFFKDSLSHGNLIIEFHVLMPKRGTLTPEQIKQLALILPGQLNPRPVDSKYDMLEDFSKQQTNTSEEGGHKNEEEEELEEEEGGSGCQNQ